jgi:ABC-type transporter Mla subunit MlaD
MSVSIDTPYVGQGIEPGTAVVMHGVTVGQVTNVTSLPGGGVQLVADLQKKPLAGLTDSMNIDFRPINYFGVPGVNFIPGSGGQPLRDGSQLKLAPKGNFTLSEMLSQLGDVSAGALTPKLITVVDRATRYTDGLNPMFETMLTITKAVEDTQFVTTAQLLANTTAASTGFAPFADAAIDAGERYYNVNHGVDTTTNPAASVQRNEPPFNDVTRQANLYTLTDDYFQSHYMVFLDVAQHGLFGAVGKVLSSHPDELLPLIDGLKAITDTTPALLRPANFAATITELRTRFERLYAGNGDQRALQVRLVLDSLPGIEAPLGIAVDPNPPGAVPPTEVAAGEAVPPPVEGTPHGATPPPVIEGSAG